MDGFKEQECWEEEEVHFEDLGAPEEGLGFFIFSLEKKVHAVARFWTLPAMLVVTLCLLVFLLPASAVLSPAAHVPSFASQQKQACVILVADSTSTASAETPWTSNTMLHLLPGTRTVYACRLRPGLSVPQALQP